MRPAARPWPVADSRPVRNAQGTGVAGESPQHAGLSRYDGISAFLLAARLRRVPAVHQVLDALTLVLERRVREALPAALLARRAKSALPGASFCSVPLNVTFVRSAVPWTSMSTLTVWIVPVGVGTCCPAAASVAAVGSGHNSRAPAVMRVEYYFAAE
jgi:hypothetical protein